MDSAAAIWAVLAAATAGVVLVLLRRAQAVRALRRGAFLDAAAVLFQRVRIAVAPTGFPRLAGWHEGAEFDIQVVPDTLSLRKLPALWVLVSLPGPLPVTRTVDVLLRPDDVLHDDASPMQATVLHKAFRGAEFLYTLQLPQGGQVYSLVPSHHNHAIGEKIGIRLELDHLVAYPRDHAAATRRQT